MASLKTKLFLMFLTGSHGISSNLAHIVNDCVCVCMHARACVQAHTHIKWNKRTEIKDSKQLIGQLAVLAIMGM